MENVEWLLCPVCKGKTRIKVREEFDNLFIKM